VLRRYGSKRRNIERGEPDYVYPDLVDIYFDHRGESRGHFTSGIQVIA
jgi:hypothetical protein